MKKKLNLCSLICVIALALLSAGCGSLLTYSGDDFNKVDSKIVQTRESFVFSTYVKKSQETGLTLRAGISKAPVLGVLVAYLEFYNPTSEEQTFYIRDLDVLSGEEALLKINPSDYLNAYQGEQTGFISSMQSMAPNIRSVATLSNAFANDSRNAANEYAMANSSTKDIADIVSGISMHTIKSAATIKPGSTSYYYVFFQDVDKFPLDLVYKDLKYPFMGKISK